MLARAKEEKVRVLAVALLALVFVGSAAQKPTGALDPERDHPGIAPPFWSATAQLELVGVLGLVTSLGFPRLATPAGLWIAAIMVGAVVARFRAGDPPHYVVLEAALLASAMAVAVLGGRARKRVG